jgi:transcriptional regulator with XRE-family HTH domain
MAVTYSDSLDRRRARIAANLKRIRAQTGLSQVGVARGLAERLGISESTAIREVQFWEAAEYSPRFDRMAALGEIFGVDPGWFDQDHPAEEDPDEQHRSEPADDAD